MLPWAKNPTFVPGETSVESYARSVQFLFSLWPVQAREWFVTALILKVEGAAMETIMNNPKLFEDKNQTSLENLITILGGSWDKLSLEERFGDLEVCVYQLQQHTGESTDSWISRSNAHWSRLLQKGVTLAEFQAYILLRHSRVENEDKRKLLVEAGDGLDLDTVRNSLRKLGANFFRQLTGKAMKGSKTHPVNFVNESDPKDHADHILATEESNPAEEPIDADDINEDNGDRSMFVPVHSVQKSDPEDHTDQVDEVSWSGGDAHGNVPVQKCEHCGLLNERFNYLNSAPCGRWIHRRCMADHVPHCDACAFQELHLGVCQEESQAAEEPIDADEIIENNVHLSMLADIPEIQEDEILEACASETVYMLSPGANEEP